MKKYAMIMLTVLFTGLMAFGQPQKGMRKGGFGNGNGYNNAAMACHRIPDLTEEQLEKISDLRVEMLKETQPVRNQINELKASCHTMMTSDNPDMNAIEKNIDQRSALQAQLMKSHASYRLAISKTLTDDQRVFFNSSGPGKCRMRQGGQMRRGFGGPGAWNN
ncbi:MAG TPA: Spy/CpxP family protein refolding chaperone [Bacteroidales bacterium]|nr:Spy/CpxP family protein refolding chaperone [Bacteroidales bacterium]